MVRNWYEMVIHCQLANIYNVHDSDCITVFKEGDSLLTNGKPKGRRGNCYY